MLVIPAGNNFPNDDRPACVGRAWDVRWHAMEGGVYKDGERDAMAFKALLSVPNVLKGAKTRATTSHID